MNTIKNEVIELQSYFCPYGFLDIKAVCQIGERLGMYEYELFEIIDEDRENSGYPNDRLFDPVASLLDYILQMARNKIQEVTDYDFINDYSGKKTGIYTYGNYMCSSYDYSSEAKQELFKKIKPHLNELIKDKWCQFFFTELEIWAK